MSDKMALQVRRIAALVDVALMGLDLLGQPLVGHLVDYVIGRRRLSSSLFRFAHRYDAPLAVTRR
jgi:hypothetical protein